MKEEEMDGAIRSMCNYLTHHINCAKNAPMPMESRHTYSFPEDWNVWRDAQPCTCGMESTMAKLKALKG